jgi:hypothetical protein
MNKLNIIAVSCLAVGSLCACTNDEDVKLGDMSLDIDAITVGEYPAYDDIANSRTSEIGTYDAGKTAWADGDVIYLNVSVSDESKFYTLTYSGEAWTCSDNITISSAAYNSTVTYKAYYAPNYELSDNQLVLKEGCAAGTAEYLTYEGEVAYSKLTGFDIKFTRDYSRLRIACGESAKALTFSISGFTPAEGGDAAASYTLISDDNKNVYLYGSWSEDCKIQYGETTTGFSLGYKFSTASATGSSYALSSTTTNFVTMDLDKFSSGTAAYNALYAYSEYDDFRLVGSYKNYVYTSNSSSQSTTHNIFYGACLDTKLKVVDLTEIKNMSAVIALSYKDFSKLQTVILPSSITTIGPNAFENCKCLQSVDIPTGVKSIGASAFQNCSSLQSVTFPSGVTSIGNSAFLGCTALQEVEIPSTVDYIYGSAFSGCSSLKTVTCLAVVPPDVTESSFEKISSDKVLKVPSKSLSAYTSNSDWKAIFGTNIEAL